MPREPSPDIEDDALQGTYNPLANPLNVKPVHVTGNLLASDRPLFLSRPLLGTLVLDNKASDCRDHCANERTFLSWLRLSMYLCIVSGAIVLSFHLRAEPSRLERRMALPMGIVFWVLSLVCLSNGFTIYVRTLTKYSRHKALVQSGWGSHAVFVIVAIAIIGTCVILLSVNRTS
ncbi:uncharacterized protein CIMG_00235 [Coccidioides immitis RS]|uniref:DUF202 domain-containing protein n=4 Tax=Coccidioides immitis TaxID=5501 RepID=A0A0E1RZP8_COCIM|nr:uncharacterized protein CIMG_00235 [Coccidioides immitis RS]KMP00071.1 hypothetical protein CIRG_00213 [Coccidioides immitis RMSCC 2394]KMU81838.1 hypothetical protein CISG_02854 [Coccidioides immitis RMSCC 3703]KMU87173.1 hypothetical protein CIHG_05114 [Coccidioides immitis H538.4]TPX26802.1 hypothetical protein DIZ76_012264 [Coccidioides immitis]EAS34881.1 hypothetical protein CIMG_00235 [Coccidioides immitis RS]